MMDQLVYRLWAMSLQADVLILIVLAARFFLRRYPRIYSYCLWALVGIRLLCPVWVESSFSLQTDWFSYSGFTGRQADGAIPLPEISSSQGEGLPAGDGNDAQYTDQLMPDQPMPDQAGGQEAEWQESAVGKGLEAGSELKPAAPDFKRKPEGGLARLLGGVYLAGAAVILLFRLVQYLRMRHRVAAAVREKGNIWLCEKIASPFVMGILFPRIYLPYDLGGKEKKYVLRHERVHIRHCDPLIRIIGTLCACLHWWNPLVWLAVYLMDQDMEMFCDETVLRHASLEERKAYAKTLLSFVEKDGRFGEGLAFGESHTKKRVKNIMKKRKRSLLMVCLAGALAVFCMAAFLTVPRTEGGDGGGGNVVSTEAIGNQGAGGSILPEEEISDHVGGSIPAEGSGEGALTDADLAWLVEVCPGIPEFTVKADQDLGFWEDYFFQTYTSDFDREQVNRYSEQYGFEIPYIRVGFEEADGMVRQIFGENLSGYGVRPEMLGAEDGNIIYEDDSLLIAASDSPEFDFSMESAIITDQIRQVTFTKTLVDGDGVSRVDLYLIPAENERGFVIGGKEETAVPQPPEGQALTGQSFDVEMNPYGMVTFAAYAPDVTASPYADVTFRLLQDGREIYSFPLQGTGVREDQAVFEGMAAVAFPDLNGDGYTDVVTIADYRDESSRIFSEVRIFIYHAGGYFLEEVYLEDAYNISHEEKTIAGIEEFVSRPENQDYFAGTSIYGRWRVEGYHLPGIYALSQQEIDSYADARLEYGAASMWTNVDGETNAVTGYEREVVATGQLEEDFRVDGAALGITGDEVVSYRVNTQNEFQFGCFFYLIDSEHALIYYEGAFFEAVRN